MPKLGIQVSDADPAAARGLVFFSTERLGWQARALPRRARPLIEPKIRSARPSIGGQSGRDGPELIRDPDREVVGLFRGEAGQRYAQQDWNAIRIRALRRRANPRAQN